MNVLLVSQCSGRALPQTRRILDQFAERRGERTWQTPITQAGLDTLRKLLKKTARKNTAVACHWIRGHDHSELIWIVGSARRFNVEGTVPTNTTTRNILRNEDENDWHSVQAIRLLAQLAGLLHDLGKASIAFQERLRGKRSERNLYRHEWVSLRLFQAFVGNDTDQGWLMRLANPDSWIEDDWIGKSRYQRDGLDAADGYPFQHLPPLAKAIAWLVVTHHRLPVVPCDKDDGCQDFLGRRPRKGWASAYLTDPLRFVAHDWNEIRQAAETAHIEAYWDPAGALPVMALSWQKQAVRLAKKLMELPPQDQSGWLDNAYVMHLARLSLMLADHHYSSLKANSSLRVKGDGNTRLYANTDRNDGTLKQPLDEHLLGVAHGAGLITHALPGFEKYLPRLANHRGLRKRSADSRFAWQDKATDAAGALRETAREHGAFVINMASTGCGKTLGNARILYALANPQQGMRVTYALGLRTLTQQTGRSYRQDLHLGDDELAVLVGGTANRELFDFHQDQASCTGSASIQELIEEDSHIFYEGNTSDHPLLSRAMADPKIRKLLSAPMLVCTVDHIVPATEALRAGRQIAPMLRLMSADLVLDELDDYDLNDLPALTRLVHWAGMLGTRVVLSSATLPPSLVIGMYRAYQEGRKIYLRNRGRDGRQTDPKPDIPCLWTDEYRVQTTRCASGSDFRAQHQKFIDKRASKLKQATPLRRGELLPLTLSSRQRQRQPQRNEFATSVRSACLRLHTEHANPDPDSGKQVSFGLIRMAHIDPIFDVAQALYAQGAPEGFHIHLCTYHARFPLIQRSAIEHMLDTTFNRRGDSEAVFHLPEIRSALDAHPEKNHVFIVLASPVCEVGRDWDADWAVVEPSSMRSLIQLAGRVQRHRGTPCSQPNMLILDTNLKHFANHDDTKPCFLHPGYEKKTDSREFQLDTHHLNELLHEHEYQVITALPRVHPRAPDQWHARQNLVDLEQRRTACATLPLGPPDQSFANAPQYDAAHVAWNAPKASLTGILPQYQPFRHDSKRDIQLAFLPDDDEQSLHLHRIETQLGHRLKDDYIFVDAELRHDVRIESGAHISPWGTFDLMSLLAEQAERLDSPLRTCAKRFATVSVPDNKRGWRYHLRLGFANNNT